MEALNAMMQRLGRTDPRLAEEMRLQQEENRRRDEETRLRSHFGAAGRPTGENCVIKRVGDDRRGAFLNSGELHP